MVFHAVAVAHKFVPGLALAAGKHLVVQREEVGSRLRRQQFLVGVADDVVYGAPGATWSASVPMQVMQGAAQVAGYRLLAFYP